MLHSCELVLDISRPPEGLKTVVGTSDLQLSGGQKQRVVRTAYVWKCKMLIIFQVLARAVFARPDFLLLDDIFSALDTVTGSRIFQRVFGSAGIIRQLGSGVMIVAVSGNYSNQQKPAFFSECY